MILGVVRFESLWLRLLNRLERRILIQMEPRNTNHALVAKQLEVLSRRVLLNGLTPTATGLVLPLTAHGRESGLVAQYPRP